MHQHSKFLSFILRHQPDSIGLQLDPQGWANIDALLHQARQRGTLISHDQLLAIVANSDKQRFAISDDGLRIRANQGHSVAIDLALTPQTPPDILLHGTASRFLASILQQGLLPMQRQQVHLTTQAHIAREVGARYGEVCLLQIDARQMVQAGHVFFCSQNGVWLTAAVPAPYITLL